MTEAISRNVFQGRPLPIEAVVLAQQFVLLPLYFFVPLWIAALNTGVAIAVVYAHKKPRFKISKWLKLLITSLAILGILIAFRKFSGRDAGIALISAMYGLKILEVNSKRDATLILGLGFFMIVAGFLFSQKPLIAFYQFIPVIAILNAFLALQSLTPFKLMSTSLFGIIKDLGRYLLIAIPIMIILFVFVPRLGGPIWRMPGATSSISGVSDSMSLLEVSDLQLSDKVAFRVNFQGEAPKESDLYWRVLALDNFDGLTWTRSRQSRIPDHRNVENITDKYDYAVTMEATELEYLVTLDRPLSSPKNGGLVSDYTAYSRFQIKDRIRYSISSQPSLIVDKSLSDEQRQHYTALPARGNSSARDWALERRSSVTNDHEYIQSILKHINQQEFYYTLRPPVMDEDIVDSFWLDKQRGFCEHYASSLVYLARAAGIPARVVVGYQGGEKNPLSDYWIVREANAHAWTEIWFREIGWIRVDPTAAIAMHRIEEDVRSDYNQRLSLFDDFDVIELDEVSFIKELQYWMDQMNTNWNDWILDYNSARQLQLFRNWGLKNVSNDQLFIGMILLVMLFVSLSGVKWLHSKEKRDPLSKAFNRLIDKLTLKQIIKKEEILGPQEIIERLRANDSVAYQEHIKIIKEYIRYRFAGKTLERKSYNLLVKKLNRLQP